MNLIYEIKGNVNPNKLTAFAFCRDEMFNFPAFLDHYRRIGVEQFIILDDHSTDGSREYICDQSDVVVLGSDFDFTSARHWRVAIPHRYLLDKWAVHTDLDEFMILPPGMSALEDLIVSLEGRNCQAVYANQIEFYPKTLDDMRQPASPKTFDRMLSQSPYFDARRTLRTRWFLNPKKIDRSATSRLFERHIRDANKHGLGNLMKTPLVKWSEHIKYRNGHQLENSFAIRHSRRLIITAHMKFNCDLIRRIEDAIASGVRAGQKYEEYTSLFAAMEARNDLSFLGPDSKRYQSTEQLYDAVIEGRVQSGKPDGG